MTGLCLQPAELPAACGSEQTQQPASRHGPPPWRRSGDCPQGHSWLPRSWARGVSPGRQQLGRFLCTWSAVVCRRSLNGPHAWRPRREPVSRRASRCSCPPSSASCEHRAGPGAVREAGRPERGERLHVRQVSLTSLVAGSPGRPERAEKSPSLTRRVQCPWHLSPAAGAALEGRAGSMWGVLAALFGGRLKL